MSILVKNIFFNVEVKNKDELFSFISSKAKNANVVEFAKDAKKLLLEREAQISTGLEKRIAIPHAIGKKIKVPTAYILRLKKPIEWETLDNDKNVDTIICLLVSKDASSNHLQALANISSKLIDPKIIEIIKTGTKQNICNALNDHGKKEPVQKVIKNKNNNRRFLVGISACAAGIAHTYMAKDKLFNAANELGYDIKIETRGALTSNTLSAEDIKEAEAIVIAADIDIDKSQFNNKRIYYSNTNDAIKDPHQFIQNALTAKVYRDKEFIKKSKLQIAMEKNYISNSIFDTFRKLLPFLGIIILFQAIPYIILYLTQNQVIDTSNKGMANAIYIFGVDTSTIFVAFAGMLIALKIGGKPAMPGALLGSFFLNNPSYLGSAWNHPDSALSVQGNLFTGLIWAVIIGIIVGHLCRLMRYIKWHKAIQTIEGFLIIPIVTTFLSFLICTFLFGEVSFILCQVWTELMNSKIANLGIIMFITFVSLIFYIWFIFKNKIEMMKNNLKGVSVPAVKEVFFGDLSTTWLFLSNFAIKFFYFVTLQWLIKPFIKLLNHFSVKNKKVVDKKKNLLKMKEDGFVAIYLDTANKKSFPLIKNEITKVVRSTHNIVKFFEYSKNINIKNIKKASHVLIVSDDCQLINKNIFSGYNVGIISSDIAIGASKKIFQDLDSFTNFEGKSKKVGVIRIGNISDKKSILKSLLFGISYMIPVVVASGILVAIPNALTAGGNASGGTWRFQNAFIKDLFNFSIEGLKIMIPVFGGFLALSIAGEGAFVAGLIGSFVLTDSTYLINQTNVHFSIDQTTNLANNISAGFLGAIVFGLLAGYIYKLLVHINHKYIYRKNYIPKYVNDFVIPVILIFIVFIFSTYIIGGALAWIMGQLFSGLSSLGTAGPSAFIPIGILFGALIGTDLGGPINKTALVVGTLIFTNGITKAAGDPSVLANDIIFIPQTSTQAAISVPPLAMFISSIILSPRKFNAGERISGISALPMGLVGISEGALPFAFRTPGKCALANILGCGVAGGLVAIFKIHFFGGLGSPLAVIVGYIANNHNVLSILTAFEWIFSVLAGVMISATIYTLLRKKDLNNIKNYNLMKQNEIKRLVRLGVNGKINIFIFKQKRGCRKFVKNIPYFINPRNWFHIPEF